MADSSIIGEIGVEAHFRNLATVLEDIPTSRTKVRVDSLTYKIWVGAKAKAFPNVLEAVVDPVKLMMRGGRREIVALENVSTVLEPEKLYLVLGGPKSGKTSLLKGIAGRLPEGGRGITRGGEVTYNGQTAGKGAFDMTSVACLVEEYDLNEPLLTVRETLLFAGACILPAPTRRLVKSQYFAAIVDSLDLDDESKEDLLAYKNVSHPKVRLALAKQRADMVLTILGLNECADTIVGDATHRGISGGERRRVTLGEVLMGNFSVTCFDEISNGLDSAAASDIIRMIRASVQSFHLTCAISLLQPAPEIFALFDEVIVTQGGQIVYQGTPNDAKVHFESLGFYCPPDSGVADFIVQVTGSNNDNLRSSSAETAEAGLQLLPSRPSVMDTRAFVDHFKSSQHGRALALRMEQSSYGSTAENGLVQSSKATSISSASWKDNETRRFQNTWTASFVICLRREATLLLRDRSYILARLMQDFFLGLLTGFIYWNISAGYASTIFGAIYQTVLTVGFQTAACVPAYFQQRHVFYKQKNSAYFSCSSYLVAATLAAMPMVVVDSVVFGALVYWCMGFSRNDAGLHFWIFLAHLVVVGWAMMALFKLNTYICPTLATSVSCAGTITFFLLLFSGFILAQSSTPWYYIWIVWLNPLYYSFHALACNEFLTGNYMTEIPGMGISVGEAILQQRGLGTSSSWIWLGILANIGIIILYVLLTWVAMTTFEWKEPVNLITEKEKEGAKQSTEIGSPVSPQRSDDATYHTGHGGSLNGDENEEVMGNDGMVVLQVDEEMKENVRGDEEESSRPTSYRPTSLFYHRQRDEEEGGREDAWRRSAQEEGRERETPIGGSRMDVLPLTLTFEDLWYSVSVNGQGKVDLLQGITGFVTPGKVMALMGASGAGKTTLLDVLAGRKTDGKIRGNILVNGKALQPDVFKSISGYVEQNDLHSPFMTVIEILRFSAELRLSKNLPRQTKRRYVDDIVRILELDAIRDSVVGPPGAGLLGEELKRITLGVEVVANPSILFLDEPTSGLDARAAMIVMGVLKRLAATGRTIICSIHQPSAELFVNFDSLLLLQKGGQTVFFGDLGAASSNLINYLGSIPGTPVPKPADNPATWMLECIGAGTLNSRPDQDFSNLYKSSRLCVRTTALMKKYTQPEPGMPNLKARVQASLWKQIRVCVVRAWRSYWRFPDYHWARIYGAAALGIVLGSVYCFQSQNSVADLVGFIALIFLSTTFYGAINSTSVLEVVHLERPSFCRERFANMYSVVAYSLSWLVVEIPYVLVETFVLVNLLYWTCHFNPDPWRWAWFTTFSFAYMMFATAFGQAVGAIAPSTQVAQSIINTIAPVFSMMSGMTFMPEQMPAVWRALWVLTPFNKAFEGLVMTQWAGDNRGELSVFDPMSKKFETLSRWGFVQWFFGKEFSFDHRWRNLGDLLAAVVVCNTVFYLALRYCKFEKR